MTTFSEFAAARLDEAGQDTGVQLRRDLLAEHAPDDPGKLGGWDANCQRCITDRGRWKEDWPDDPYPCRTLRLIFAAWSDHPDYDPAWAPGEVTPWI